MMCEAHFYFFTHRQIFVDPVKFRLQPPHLLLSGVAALRWATVTVKGMVIAASGVLDASKHQSKSRSNIRIGQKGLTGVRKKEVACFSIRLEA